MYRLARHSLRPQSQERVKHPWVCRFRFTLHRLLFQVGWLRLTRIRGQQGRCSRIRTAATQQIVLAMVGWMVQELDELAEIKNQVLKLLMCETDSEPLLKNLASLFLMNPSSERTARNLPRKQSSHSALLNFHKRRKKHCY